jgi:hypothetical protein
MHAPDDVKLSPIAKAMLALQIYAAYGRVHVELRFHPLPQAVTRLGRRGRRKVELEPVRLGRIVFGLLRLGRKRARCLYTSLVLFKLLRQEGVAAELVIGLPREPRDKDGHAWIEIDRVDVGPPPGGSRHEELARYG